MKINKLLTIFLAISILFSSFPLYATAEESDLKNYLIKFRNLELAMSTMEIKIQHEYNHIPLVRAKLNESQLIQLSQSPYVEFIEQDNEIRITPQFNLSVDQEVVLPFDAVTDGGTQAVKIAVIDTGITEVDNLKLAGGASFVSDINNFVDDLGQGTYLASVVSNHLASLNPSEPGVALYSLKSFDSEGQGSVGQVIEALEWAIDHDIDIVTMGFGTSFSSLAMAEIASLATENGMLLIAAGGDEGKEFLNYPAKLNSVIAVGSIENHNDRFPSSNIGNELEFVAPGEAVVGINHEGTIVRVNGTIPSSAYVTAVAAQYWAHFPTLDAYEVRELLRANAEFIGSTESFGYGKPVFKLLNEEEDLEVPLDPEEEWVDESVDFLTQTASIMDTRTVEEIGAERLQMAEERMQHQRQLDNEQNQLQQELITLEQETLIEEFGVTEAWIREKLDEGFTIQELFSWLSSIYWSDPAESQQRLSANHHDGDLNPERDVIVNNSSNAETEIESEVGEFLVHDGTSSIVQEDVQIQDIESFTIDYLESLNEDAEAQSNTIQALGNETPEINIPIAQMSKAPYQVGLYSEDVSLLSGSLSLTDTEFTLPGRNGLSFALTRSYNSDQSQLYNMGVESSSYVTSFFFMYLASTDSRREYYDLTRHYKVTYKKFACNSDVQYDAGQGGIEGFYAGQYNTESSVASAINNPPQKGREVHQNFCSTDNRIWYKYYDYHSSTKNNYYTSWEYSGTSIGEYSSSSRSSVETARSSYVSGITIGPSRSGGGSIPITESRTTYHDPTPIYDGDVSYSHSNIIKSDPLDNKFPIGKGWSFNIPYVSFEYGKTYVGMGDGSVYEVNGTQLKNYPWSDLSFVSDTSVSYNGRPSAYALKSVFGQSSFFDNSGNLIQIKDAYNNTVSFTYSNVSPYGTVLTKITDAIGNTIDLSYTTSKVTITSGNRAVTYDKVMSSEGKELLSKATDPLGRQTTYSYNIRNASFNLVGSTPQRNNPYALLTKVVHPTGVETKYTYETNAVTRYIGSGQVNQAYRLAERKDTVTYSVTGPVDKNISTFVYSSDMAASYGTNTSFSTTLFDGLLETKMTYEKKHFNNPVGPVYYHKQTSVSDGTIAKISELTYDENKRRTNPISTTTYVKNILSQASTTPITTSVVYDDYKNVTSATNAFGLTSTYTYDGTSKRLLSSTEPTNATQRIFTEIVSRNSQGSITESRVRENNASGAILHHNVFTYDSHGNVTLIRNKDVDRDVDIIVEYGAAYSQGFPTKITRPYKDVSGASKTQVITATFNKLTGQVATYTPGNQGSVPGVTFTSTYTYDKLGRLTELKHPDQSQVTLTYDDVNNMITQTDEMSRQVYTKWDPLGQEIESGWFEGGTRKAKTKTGYDQYGRVSWVENADGKRTVPTFDSWGRTIQTTLPGNKTTSSMYKDVEQTMLTTDAVGNRILETLDTYGRAIKREEGRGTSGFATVWSGVYDTADRLISEQDSKNIETKYEYNAMGQLVSVTNAHDEKYAYSYNRQGLLTRVTYPDLQVKVHAYDELGQLIRKTSPGQQVETFEYDNNGNRTKLIDAKGQVFTYQYNNRDFLLSKSGPTETISFTHNNDGSRQMMTDRGNNNTVYDYHEFTGQLKRVTFPDGKQIAYTYDGMANRASMTLPFGDTVQYGYNDVNYLEEVSWNGSIVAEYDYHDNGRLGNKSLGQQLLSQSYNYTDGKLTGLFHKQGNNSLRSYTYRYDNNTNITSIVEVKHGSNPLTQTFAFDYDSLNRISTSSLLNETYTYDNRGNRQTMISDTEINLSDVMYEYDAWDRLTKVTRNGQVVEYVYNGDNLMVERKQNGMTTRYYYDGDQIIAEAIVNANGSVTEKASYVRGSTDLILREDANQNKGYYLHNGHGDVVGIRGSNGQILNEYKYDIWGKPLTSEESVDNPFLYSGEYWDGTTQLQYLRARWYDPTVGRFISPAV